MIRRVLFGFRVLNRLELLWSNEGMVLVMPAFPGVEVRKSRSRPWTKTIEKIHTTLKSSVKAAETTCDHPYSLAGWVNLLDIERYRKVGPRQRVREHRCGGQLVKGKRCKSLAFIRGCGGMRHWEYALECVICNRPDLRQAQLLDWNMAWVQKAPILAFRSELAEMRQGIKAIENKSMSPVLGMDFAVKPKNK
ncbi:unnamed protein product [Durusdinium trenchii]|uniref:Uncharacterized protein n=1 Tax=Durusdinium trenchii TaxID=1381693 RepID=A0ABP0P2V0_9DINO